MVDGRRQPWGRAVEKSGTLSSMDGDGVMTEKA